MARPRVVRSVTIKEYSNGDYSMKGDGGQPTVLEALNMVVAHAHLTASGAEGLYKKFGFASKNEYRESISWGLVDAIRATILEDRFVGVEVEQEEEA